MTSKKRIAQGRKRASASRGESQPTRYLIVFYSRTGFTRRVAHRLAQRLGASSDIEEIQDHRKRAGVLGFLRTAFEAVMKRAPDIAPSQFDPANYDVVVGSPVWAAHVATPVRSYLKRHAPSLVHVGMFCTMGSSGGDETLAEMTGMLHLFHAGDPAEHIYVVRGGALKTYVVSPGGNEEVRGFQLADDVAGLDAVCHARFCTSARAISRAWVCRLPIAAVRSRMLESASFRDRVLTALGREFDRLHSMLHRERCTADQRVASFLLSQLNSDSPNSNAIELSMSRADLARHLDLATETVSRVFARLQSRQIVRSEGARCEVIDRSALSALI